MLSTWKKKDWEIITSRRFTDSKTKIIFINTRLHFISKNEKNEYNWFFNISLSFENIYLFFTQFLVWSLNCTWIAQKFIIRMDLMLKWNWLSMVRTNFNQSKNDYYNDFDRRLFAFVGGPFHWDCSRMMIEAHKFHISWS